MTTSGWTFCTPYCSDWARTRPAASFYWRYYSKSSDSVLMLFIQDAYFPGFDLVPNTEEYWATMSSIMSRFPRCKISEDFKMAAILSSDPSTSSTLDKDEIRSKMRGTHERSCILISKRVVKSEFNTSSERSIFLPLKCRCQKLIFTIFKDS